MRRLWKWAAIFFCFVLATGCGRRNFTEEAIQQQIGTTAFPTANSTNTTITTETTTMSTATTGETNTGELVDLTTLNSNMVYSEVFQMVNAPDSYVGKNIRAKGLFSYYQDEKTKKEYFAVIVLDALGCCSQGIEFVLRGEHSYPQDYPELESEITVEGTFCTYTDDTGTYIQLQDAVLE